MSVTNCSAAGADSYTQAITGAVMRKDKTTGQAEPASIRGNGLPSGTTNASQNATAGVSLSSGVLGALLSSQEG